MGGPGLDRIDFAGARHRLTDIIWRLWWSSRVTKSGTPADPVLAASQAEILFQLSSVPIRVLRV